MSKPDEAIAALRNLGLSGDQIEAVVQRLRAGEITPAQEGIWEVSGNLQVSHRKDTPTPPDLKVTFAHNAGNGQAEIRVDGSGPLTIYRNGTSVHHTDARRSKKSTR